MNTSPENSKGPGDRIEALERLGRLRAEGLLTEEEFSQEKARVLNAATPSSIDRVGQAAAKIGSPAPTEATVAASSEVAPDDNDLLAPIRPINGDLYASFLVRKVWTVFAALAALELMSVVVRIFQLVNGEAWSLSVSRPAGIALGAGYLVAVILVLWGLSRWVARRGSRLGAVALTLLAGGAVLTAVLRPLSEGLWLKLGAVVLAGFALWFLIGVLRGAFALSGRRPIQVELTRTEPRSGPAAPAKARETSVSIRRVIGWIALGWLGLFLIGGGWFWWSMRGEGASPATTFEASPTSPVIADPNGVVASASAPAQGGAGAIALTREVLVGVWAPQGQACVGWGAYELREDGQVLAEGADGQWGISFSNLVLQIRSYDMDTEQPGPVENLGGFVEMISRDAFRLTRDGAAVTYVRCPA